MPPRKWVNWKKKGKTHDQGRAQFQRRYLEISWVKVSRDSCYALVGFGSGLHPEFPLERPVNGKGQTEYGHQRESEREVRKRINTKARSRGWGWDRDLRGWRWRQGESGSRDSEVWKRRKRRGLNLILLITMMVVAFDALRFSASPLTIRSWIFSFIHFLVCCSSFSSFFFFGFASSIILAVGFPRCGD